MRLFIKNLNFCQKIIFLFFRDESGYTSSPQKDIIDTPPRTYTSQAKSPSETFTDTTSSSPSSTAAKYSGQMISPLAAAAANNALSGIGYSFLTPSLMPTANAAWINTLRIMQLNALQMSQGLQQHPVKQANQAEPLDLSQNHPKRQKVNTFFHKKNQFW